MDALFASGKVVDLILLLMAGEAALLVYLHSRGRFPIPPLRFLPNLLAGACLLTGVFFSQVLTWVIEPAAAVLMGGK
jgi:hypothetical protein